jgi:hypothetical protein
VVAASLQLFGEDTIASVPHSTAVRTALAEQAIRAIGQVFALILETGIGKG